MVATVEVLRSSAVAVSYYEDDGYYARNDPEHRQASFWHGDAAKALGLRAHVRPSRFESVLSGYVPGTDLRLGRMREGQHECQSAFNIDPQSACKIDGVDASSRRHRSVPRWWRDQPPEEEASMEQVNIIGIDLAKRSFQLHGARADGSVAFRRKVSRERLLYILGAQQRCVVAMEACASAHYWGREILKLGHEVRLVPPIYVKPFVKRQKNDAADAEAICEAEPRSPAVFETRGGSVSRPLPPPSE